MAMSPTEQAEFDKLKNRVMLLEGRNQLQASPASSPSPSKSSPLTITLSIIVAVVVVAGFAGGAVWAVHFELSKRDDAIGKIDKRMDGLKMAIKVLGDAQGGKTKELVDDALTISKLNLDAGKSIQAQSALSIANAFMADLNSSKIQVDPRFFTESIDKLRSIRTSPYATPTLTDEAFRGAFELAKYRSILSAQIYAMPKLSFPRIEHGWVYKGGSAGSSISGLYMDASHMTGDLVKVEPTLTGTLADNIRVNECVIKGGFQTLDGIFWSEDTFIGSHIRYRGGQLSLNHVRFIGCTFEIPETKRGTDFAEYVALLLPKFSLG